MKHILKYKIFESDINEEISENIELCKDFIETFNESDDKFKISNYIQGWTPKNYISYRDNHKEETDRVAIDFDLGLKKDLNERGYFTSFDIGNEGDRVTEEGIEDVIQILSKSKFLLHRLNQYCTEIAYKISDKTVSFTLVFDNPDKNSANQTKYKRIYKELREKLKDYNTVKTIKMDTNRKEDNDSNRERVKLKEDLLRTIIKKPELKESDTRHSPIYLRYSATESLEGNVITIKIGPYKYKTWNMERYRKINLDSNEIEIFSKLIIIRIINSVYDLKDNSTITSENDKIIITIN